MNRFLTSISFFMAIAPGVTFAQCPVHESPNAIWRHPQYQAKALQFPESRTKNWKGIPPQSDSALALLQAAEANGFLVGEHLSFDLRLESLRIPVPNALDLEVNRIVESEGRPSLLMEFGLRIGGSPQNPTFLGLASSVLELSRTSVQTVQAIVHEQGPTLIKTTVADFAPPTANGITIASQSSSCAQSGKVAFTSDPVTQVFAEPHVDALGALYLSRPATRRAFVVDEQIELPFLAVVDDQSSKVTLRFLGERTLEDTHQGTVRGRLFELSYVRRDTASNAKVREATRVVYSDDASATPLCIKGIPGDFRLSAIPQLASGLIGKWVFHLNKGTATALSDEFFASQYHTGYVPALSRRAWEIGYKTCLAAVY